ncbi:MAG: efflux RND transporter periplasmic adaptor subunit [Lentisphaeria bacterium]|nr:efflux RND transporter periplasmic adaptor subunit [Lentisphaeria bacterium]
MSIGKRIGKAACVTAGIFLFAGAVLCGQEKSKAQGAPQGKAPAKPAMPAMPVPTVGVAKVFMAEDVLVRHYVGQTVSVAVVNVTPRVSGEILKVGFEDGAHVKAGQVLYTLDSVQYDATVKSCEAKIAECKAKYDYALSNFERNNALMKQKAVSRDAWENARSAMEGFKASLLAAEAALISAKDNLKNTTITAPIDGVAGVTNFTKGNYITPSSGTLVTIVQVSPIRVRFAMSSADLLTIFESLKDMKTNTTVQVTLADGTTLKEAGKVEFLNNEVNRKTDSILLYARLSNKNLHLYPGMTVRVTVSKNLHRKLPAVLPSAVMHDGKTAYVYVVGPNNIPVKRAILPGNSNGKRMLVEKGLKDGETVIVAGTNKVFPGVPVNPVMEK